MRILKGGNYTASITPVAVGVFSMHVLVDGWVPKRDPMTRHDFFRDEGKNTQTPVELRKKPLREKLLKGGGEKIHDENTTCCFRTSELISSPERYPS